MTLNQLLRRGTVTWHGVRLDQPDWSPVLAHARGHDSQRERPTSCSTSS